MISLIVIILPGSLFSKNENDITKESENLPGLIIFALYWKLQENEALQNFTNKCLLQSFLRNNHFRTCYAIDSSFTQNYNAPQKHECTLFHSNFWQPSVHLQQNIFEKIRSVHTYGVRYIHVFAKHSIDFVSVIFLHFSCPEQWIICYRFNQNKPSGV